MKTPPPKPGQSGPPASAAQFRMKEEADKRRKKPSAIQGLAKSMANAAVGQAKSMASTAYRTASIPSKVTESMIGTAGRLGRKVNPFD